MNIIGIDQSLTSTAITIFNIAKEKLIHYELIKTTKKEEIPQFLRIKNIKDKIIELSNKYNCHYAAIERLSLGNKNSRSSRDLSALYYSILIGFYEDSNIDLIYGYTPLTVKAFAIGGKADKILMFEKLPEDIKKEFLSVSKKTTGLFDLTDSYYIGLKGIKDLKKREEKNIVYQRV